MNKLILIAGIAMTLLSCSKEDDQSCKTITFVGERTIWYQAGFRTFEVISGYYNNDPSTILDFSLPDLEDVKVGDEICN